MSLRKEQSIFLKNIAKLILWAFENGYELTGGELQRTMYQQRKYIQEGKSKTLRSRHLSKKALDLNLFIDGKYVADTDSHRPLGEYWKSLHPKNRWGGDWKFKDGNHYEMI